MANSKAMLLFALMMFVNYVTRVQGQGVTLNVYDNMALYGSPSTTRIQNTTSFLVSAADAELKPFSAELVGTIAFPATGGVYHFDCNWTASTMGFVWVDGHMICQDGHSYKNDAGTTDNPLPVNYLNRSKGIVTSLPFRAHFYYDGKSIPTPPKACTAKSVGVYDDHNHQCGFTQLSGTSNQNTWATAAAACYDAGYTVAAAEASLGQEIFCGHTLTPTCPRSKHTGVPCPGNASETCGDAWFLEVITFECVPQPSDQGAGVSVEWAPMSPSTYEAVLTNATTQVATLNDQRTHTNNNVDADDGRSQTNNNANDNHDNGIGNGNGNGNGNGSGNGNGIGNGYRGINGNGGIDIDGNNNNNNNNNSNNTSTTKTPTLFGEIVDRLFSNLPHVSLPTTSLSPTLPMYEAQRDELQRSIATGWGPWLHANMLPIVKLPDAAMMTPMLCSKTNGNCIESCVPDGALPRPSTKPPQGAETRVGHHAFDRSYVQFYVGGGQTPGAPTNHSFVNVSIEYSCGGDGNNDVDVLLTVADCGGNCSDWTVVLGGRWAWFKAGVANATAGGAGEGLISFSAAGMPPFTVYSTAPSVIGKLPTRYDTALTIDLTSGSVGFSTTKGATTATIATQLAVMKASEEALLVKTFGADRATQGQAVKASIMWNLISTPAENGGAPLLPVSRVWNFAQTCINDDFGYAIFDWDNLFASLLAASGAPSSLLPSSSSSSSSSPFTWGGFEYAVSNLFQVVKSKTAAGFVPNFAAGGLRSQDRTEPPIGAKVLLELVKKFGVTRMQWVVEALFDDLLDWSDWFLRKRLKPPLNMVALGTFNDQNHQAGNMQDARYESGLDNSPMYDGTFVNSTNGCTLYESGCGLMQLYDVGMTSMFVQEAFALAELATITGRPQSLSTMLTTRGKDMSQKITDHLWNEDLGNFVNRFSADHMNGSFYEHVSPTSFYALQAHAATDAQAATMAETWLLNSSRFCIASNGDYVGNNDTCYWGLPSIEASDPAYPPLGYWRGYIWGPMAQLTFWSLQNYDHVPQIRTARKALCKQMAGLMMSQWNQNRHICENYNPHKDADTTQGDCSGTRFYHWGALTGLIGLIEDGLF